VIKGTIAVVDCHKIGYTEMLLLFLRVNSTVKIDQILADLNEIEKINAIYQVTGNYPLFCMAKCIGKEDEMQVMEAIKAIPGIEEIITNIVLKCEKENLCLRIPG
jgi:DNA-binding Lrp family transcriptional regulator